MAASLASMAVSSHGGWAWYLLITVQWLSLLIKAFRWDISAVSSCSFEKRFVNCHFELNIQRILTTTWHLRQITSPVFTHPVVSERCPLCSEAIHSSYTKWNQLASSLWFAGHFQHLLILWKQAILTYHVTKKRWSPAGLRYLGSAVALLHFSSHWLPGDREFRALCSQPKLLHVFTEISGWCYFKFRWWQVSFGPGDYFFAISQQTILLKMLTIVLHAIWYCS